MLTEFTPEQSATLRQVKFTTDTLANSDPKIDGFQESASELKKLVESNVELLKKALYFDGLPYITYVVKRNSPALNYFLSRRYYVSRTFSQYAFKLEGEHKHKLLEAFADNTSRLVVVFGISVLNHELGSSIAGENFGPRMA